MIKTATNRPIREIRFLFPRNQDFSSQNVIDRIIECRDNERRINDSPIDVVRRIVGYDFCFFLFFFFPFFSPSSSIEFLFIELNGEESSFRTNWIQFVHRDAVSSDYLNYSDSQPFDRKNTSNSPISFPFIFHRGPTIL